MPISRSPLSVVSVMLSGLAQPLLTAPPPPFPPDCHIPVVQSIDTAISIRNRIATSRPYPQFTRKPRDVVHLAHASRCGRQVTFPFSCWALWKIKSFQARAAPAHAQSHCKVSCRVSGSSSKPHVLCMHALSSVQCSARSM